MDLTWCRTSTGHLFNVDAWGASCETRVWVHDWYHGGSVQQKGFRAEEFMVDISNYPLVMTNSLPLYRWPVEIDGLPSYKMVIYHGYVSHNQMASWIGEHKPAIRRGRGGEYCMCLHFSDLWGKCKQIQYLFTARFTYVHLPQTSFIYTYVYIQPYT